MFGYPNASWEGFSGSQRPAQIGGWPGRLGHAVLCFCSLDLQIESKEDICVISCYCWPLENDIQWLMSHSQLFMSHPRGSSLKTLTCFITLTYQKLWHLDDFCISIPGSSRTLIKKWVSNRLLYSHCLQKNTHASLRHRKKTRSPSCSAGGLGQPLQEQPAPGPSGMIRQGCCKGSS